ncbi:MAG: porin family protein [Bradyrhizobium sp.]|nr:MAG: porin family protein [Bradyrhizobium sp.]
MRSNIISYFRRLGIPILKKFLAALLCSLPFAASAADLPRAMPVKAPVAVIASDWTGAYIGVHVGYGWGTSNTSVTPGNSWIGDPDWPNVNAASTNSLKPNGPFGGAQIGYNQQFKNFLLGIEADFSYFGMKKSANSGTIACLPNPDCAGGTFSVYTETKGNWVSTIRPRLGWVNGNTLLYVTGGLAIADVGYSQSINFFSTVLDDLPHTPDGGGANAGSVSKTQVGWALGVGGEYRLDQNWSLKAEYLHIDLGSQGFNSTYVEPPPFGRTFSVSHTQELTLDTVRLGLNRHF